ncbi:methyltransferase family protein [Roseibium hamelinense]|uniref:Methyltransferase family protein n=1 Tax=Roseibium hamelinense TaxID=150831 RepID=A0A562TIJ0_9HYPH|nr:class I SAM-dependent methyltransferase [Roseibium hamelinense]MTI46091.1 class I SAM-dependent methyltransferase [Roseibium hamelinense]TWI92716.1 methyltransferase family protein [Roseibium hamelinense]
MSITPEDVQNCFQFLLGRSAEDQAVEHFRQNCNSTEELRTLVMRSEEFHKRVLGSQFHHPISFVEHRTNQSVDVDSSAQDLEKLWDHVGRSWSQLGKEQPYFSVVTSDEYLSENIPANEEKFWSTGVHDFDRISMIFKECGLSADQFPTALEYGCGVGRASLFLSRLFKTLYALDISPNHLEIADRKAKQDGIGNICFQKVDRAGLDALPAYDLFYSRIVLQHNPPPIMHYILDRLLKNLNSGGLAIFQIPVYMDGYSFETRSYLKTAKPGMEMHVLPQSSIFKLLEVHGCQPLSIKEDGDIGHFGAWVSNTIVARKN